MLALKCLNLLQGRDEMHGIPPSRLLGVNGRVIEDASIYFTYFRGDRLFTRGWPNGPWFVHRNDYTVDPANWHVPNARVIQALYTPVARHAVQARMALAPPGPP